jgi:hypothetical protein
MLIARRSLLCCVLLGMCVGAFGVATPMSYQSKDGSILQPTDNSYVEAMAFAQFLDGKGIIVKSVHLSKLNGFFEGLHKAAFFRTEKGVADVIFFPKPAGAEGVRVTEQRREGRYIYSFEGLPHPSAGDAIDASRQMYFLTHGDWFIVIDKEELYDAIKRALLEG